MKKYLILIFLNCIVSIISTSQVLQNGSFETSQIIFNDDFMQVPGQSTLIDGWIVGNDTLDYIGSYWSASNGVRSIDLNGSFPSSISQNIITQRGLTYTIQFDFAGNPVCSSPSLKTMEISAGNKTQTFTYNVTGNTVNNMRWEVRTFDFTAVDGNTLLTFKSLTPGPCGPAIDNVQFVKRDCSGAVNGNAIIDSCGVCIDKNSPDFNKTCTDCTGLLNGSAVIDSCGICLLPSSPNFNQSCIDCAGRLNGKSIIDACGMCLLPTSTDFNKSCSDCAGVIYGYSILDSCGICLLESSPDFNQSCIDCAGNVAGELRIDDCGICLNPRDLEWNQRCKNIYIPNIISLGSGNINSTFVIQKDEEIDAIVKDYLIFDRWGNCIYKAYELSFDSESLWWDGSFNGKLVEPGNYTYIIKVEYLNNSESLFKGTITVIN